MAWDASFSTLDAGGWMDSGYGNDQGVSKDSELSKIGERLPVPVTIANLADSVHSAADKYVLGTYHFATVTTIGIVKSIQADSATHIYVLQDPDDYDKEYIVNKYTTDESGADVLEDPVAEGARVIAIGKLRSFDGTNSIMAFGLHEVSDEKEYQAFVLEAQIAAMYFSKNIPQLLKTQNVKQLIGTPAGAPADHQQPGHSMGGSQAPERIYPQSGQPYGAGMNGGDSSAGVSKHKFPGQRGKIMDLLTRDKANFGEEGVSFDYIKEKIGSTSTKSLQSDLEFLVNEGHIYNTTGDDNYAVID
ncbi:unnamed protein product [Caenorhabditis auriculariae]|uniref:Replication protein A C-terminal domain-containing protein n=1 Tax=Caenorhabditis auriculariae TaxID=2777116 RepID=A0A8S1H712_9PELO|nr:unnamed protein product [Caenorhabditis auriculariae]